VAVAVVCLLFIFVMMVMLMGRMYQRKRHHFNEIPTKEEAIPISESNLMHGMGRIHLLESKAQGKFGSVFKGSVGNGDERVAVKVFTSRDYASWEQECKVYRLPQMKHQNILTFLGSEKRLDGNQISYWLVTEYLDLGSLHDYLKSRTLTYDQMVRIANSIACGLTHLHDQLSPSGSDGFKPTVAHRDFKSKNVLLKHDLTACIADFGLALIFDQNQGPIEALGQVGTRRYMAPEVLEGAISFYRDSLLRIDMYACGLVFWELISRCSAQDSAVSEYKQPFEAELGLNPTLEEMQESVCQQKQRPLIRESWTKHPGLSRMCDTIAEMWDQDAEARITAACVQERVHELYHQTVPNNDYNSLEPERVSEPAAPPYSQSRYDHNDITMTRQPLTYNAYFNNRSTCASDSPLLTQTST
jgi:activin receptor type-2